MPVSFYTWSSISVGHIEICIHLCLSMQIFACSTVHTGELVYLLGDVSFDFHRRCKKFILNGEGLATELEFLNHLKAFQLLLFRHRHHTLGDSLMEIRGPADLREACIPHVMLTSPSLCLVFIRNDYPHQTELREKARRTYTYTLAPPIHSPLESRRSFYRGALYSEREALDAQKREHQNTSRHFVCFSLSIRNTWSQRVVWTFFS